MWRFLLFLVSTSFLIASPETVNLEEKVSKETVQNFEQDDIQDQIDQEYKPIEFKHTFFKMMLWMVALVGFLVLTFYMLKKMAKNRMTFSNQTSSIKILESRNLSPKTVLYLMEYDGKKAIVAESHVDVKIKLLDD